MYKHVLLAALMMAGIAGPSAAGPEAFRVGQKLCAQLAMNYGAQYPTFAALPEADRQRVFEAVKTRQANQRLQDAAAERDATAKFVTSITGYVERLMLIMAIDEPSLTVPQVQGRLFDACSDNSRSLLDLPGP